MAPFTQRVGAIAVVNGRYFDVTGATSFSAVVYPNEVIDLFGKNIAVLVDDYLDAGGRRSNLMPNICRADFTSVVYRLESKLRYKKCCYSNRLRSETISVEIELDFLERFIYLIITSRM